VFAALMEPFHRVVGGWYKRQVEKELVKYGLRYDDLLDPKMNLVRIPPRHSFRPKGSLEFLAAPRADSLLSLSLSLFPWRGVAFSRTSRRPSTACLRRSWT